MGKKYFPTFYLEKGWMFKICNEQSKNNLIKKIGKGPEQIFSPKGTNEYMKRWAMSLIIREKQVKTKMIYHFTPLSMDIIHRTRENKCRWGCGEKGICALLVETDVSWCSHFGKQDGCFSKNEVQRCLVTQQFPSWVYIQRKWNPHVRHTFSPMFILCINNAQDVDATLCPLKAARIEKCDLCLKNRISFSR